MLLSCCHKNQRSGKDDEDDLLVSNQFLARVGTNIRYLLNNARQMGVNCSKNFWQHFLSGRDEASALSTWPDVPLRAFPLGRENVSLTSYRSDKLVV